MRFLTSPIVQGLTLGLLANQAAAVPNDVKHPTYDSLMDRDPSVRSQILSNADPAARSQVWTDRVENYRKQHTDTLSAEQSAVLDSLVSSLSSGDESALPQLKEDAIAAFGFEEAKAIATTLDGSPAPEGNALRAAKPLCTCNTGDDWCSDGYKCGGRGKCNTIPDDCGWWNAKICNGQCYAK